MELDQMMYTHKISPLENSVRREEERRGVRIIRDSGRAYHVEVRRSIGEDSRLPAIFHQGALIKEAKAFSEANKSYIVDPTPETPSETGDDNVLFPQRTFSDPESEIYISAIQSDEDGVDIVVKRGPPSVSPPNVERPAVDMNVNEQGDVSSVTLTASATPDDPTVNQEDLLYFWKLDRPRSPYEDQGFKTGSQVTLLPNEIGDEVWLVVSDQRGGETWGEVVFPE